MEGKKRKTVKHGLGGKVWRTLIFSKLSLLPLKYLQAPQPKTDPCFGLSFFELFGSSLGFFC